MLQFSVKMDLPVNRLAIIFMDNNLESHMGIFSFAKDIGDKIFNRNKKDATEQAASSAAPAAAEPTAQEIANLLLARI